jgi:hypothetical protein
VSPSLEKRIHQETEKYVPVIVGAFALIWIGLLVLACTLAGWLGAGCFITITGLGVLLYVPRRIAHNAQPKGEP